MITVRNFFISDVLSSGITFGAGFQFPHYPPDWQLSIIEISEDILTGFIGSEIIQSLAWICPKVLGRLGSI
jgi:hypothetical protein